MKTSMSKSVIAVIVFAGVLLGVQWASAGNLPSWGGATTTTNQPQVQQPGQPLVSEPAPIPGQTVQPQQPGSWTAPGTIVTPPASKPAYQQQPTYQTQPAATPQTGFTNRTMSIQPTAVDQGLKNAVEGQAEFVQCMDQNKGISLLLQPGSNKAFLQFGGTNLLQLNAAVSSKGANGQVIDLHGSGSAWLRLNREQRALFIQTNQQGQLFCKVNIVDSSTRSGSDRSRSDGSIQTKPSSGFIVMSPANSSVQQRAISRYRVVLHKFWASKKTHPESGDGAGDEVFIGARVLLVGKNGLVRQVAKIRTTVMGSVKNHPERVAAGTASKFGGIKDFDSFGSDWTLPVGFETAPPRGPDGRPVPPMILYDGQIDVEHEALLIVPTLWEWDKNNQTSAMAKWNNHLQRQVLPWAKSNALELQTLNVPSQTNEWGEINIKRFGYFGVPNLAFTRDIRKMTHPLGINCDNPKREYTYNPPLMVLNKKTVQGFTLGRKKNYRARSSNFCQDNLKNTYGTYNINISVERME